jgi:hypothetical protein
MTNEEFERIIECLRAQRSPADDIDPEKVAADAKLAEERRKLDRYLDRIERVLTAGLKAPWRPPPPTEADKRLTKALAELTEMRSKRSLDKRLDAPSDIVRPDSNTPTS